MNVLVLFLVLLVFAYPVNGVATIPDYDFDRHLTSLNSSNMSLQSIVRLGAAPYEDLMGSVFWGVLFALIFGIMWISMEDITIPALLGMIIGSSIWYLLPPDWTQFAMSLTVISLTGLVYSYLKKG